MPSLINLNINLNEQEQVKLVLERLPNLEILNEKNIKEELNQNEINEIENENETEENNENNNNINQNNINQNQNNIYQNNIETNIIQENGGDRNGENNENNENNENDNYNTNIIDLNDEEIKNISLQDEIPNFNNIYKKISQKFKSIQKNNNFKDEFQSLIKNQINKINSNCDNNIPNYIYSSNVIESQLCIYSFFTEKFLEYLYTQNEKDTYDLIKEIHDNISKSYLLLIKTIYKLDPVIEDKIQTLNIQLNEAIKHNNNVFLALNENENKIKQEVKIKDNLINSYKDKINYLESRIKLLENENNLMTEKLFFSAKRAINTERQSSVNKQNENTKTNINTIANYTTINSNSNNINNHYIKINTPRYDKQRSSQDNIFINNINNGNYTNRYSSINSNNKKFNYNLNNSLSSNSLIQASPVCNRVFTIKMMKEIINDIYHSKEEFDKKSMENKLPKETLEQHMYTYLNQKYGLKTIIIEWASNIINGIKIFSSEDSEICLFGKILRNEIEEDARFIYSSLQQSILDYLKYYFKTKYPFKSITYLNNMLKEKTTNKMLNEDEWKKIIYYLYKNEDAKILEEKVNDIIQKKYFKNKLDTEKRLTREEIIQLSKTKDEYNIPLKDLVKILHEYQIKLREKYLKNFVILFKIVDKDNNGIINEEEFVNLLYNMNIFGDQIKIKIVELLTQIDPYNNKQITFSECVNLFDNTPYYPDGSSNYSGSILDKICLSDTII